MADDLGDDWWNEDSGGDKEDQENGDELSESKPSAIPNVKVQASHQPQGQADSKGKKRPHEESGKPGKQVSQETQGSQLVDTDNEPKKKKKRRKKKKLSEHLTEKAQKPGTAEDMKALMLGHYQGKLSPIELQDYKDMELSDKSFLPCNSTSAGLSEYLKSCIPKWSNLVKKTKPVKPNACLLILVTASAKRAVDLNRQGAEFKGQCVSAKLFAKHLKIKEQVKLLNKSGAHFAVGTPNRIASLLQADAIKEDETFYVILDWNWRDVKLRRMVDMPEVRHDLFELLRKYVIPATRSSERLRIGLF